MKKAMKKLMAALLAVAMVCAMAIPAFATVDITSHTFEAYQIFAGDLNEGTLSNVTWGKNVTGDTFLAALQSEGPTNYGSCTDAKAVAEVLSNSKALANDFAKIAAKHVTGTPATGTGSVTLPSAGYYLIVDTTDVAGEHDAKNLSLLKVSGATTVTPQVKTDIPTLEKKVQDKNDSTGNTTDWQDSADYDIGDIIPYKLTATLGELKNYNTYYVKFVDTMTNLTYVTGSATVQIDNGTPLTPSQYKLTWDETSKTLAIEIANVKALGADNNSVITVEYNATLDSSAAIGSTGNPNSAYLVFSNNPNGEGTGKTPEDKNIVFTYKVDANKVDPEGNSLPGAAFELFKKVKDSSGNITWESKGVANATKHEDGTYTITDAEHVMNFVWNGIDDGDYKLVEVVTPAGYNTMDALFFTVTATHDEEAADPKLLTLTGNPFSGDVSSGILTSQIENNRGTTLPGTGGIGTTIFYVIGGGLMVAAAILLITKKRMENR